MFDLARDETNKWPTVSVVGLDGSSERLRRMVSKPISNVMLHKVLVGLCTQTRATRIYNLLGLPGETEDDLAELVEQFRAADAALQPGACKTMILQCTAFRAMPATPAACWPMSADNQAGRFGRLAGGKWAFCGSRLNVADSYGVDGPATVMLDSVLLRATEESTEAVRSVAASSRFWRANQARKMATLENAFDLDRIVRECVHDDLPTRYLLSYAQGDDRGGFYLDWRQRLTGAKATRTSGV